MSGGAMAPTMIGASEFDPEVDLPDRIAVNKWTYRFNDPQRGDITTFRMTSPLDGSSVIWIMRIVGLPGETVDIESPYVLINGERLVYPPIFARISSRQDGFTGYYNIEEIGGTEDWGISLPITLGADEYFVLGDNSPNSNDSRFVGPIPRADITGKAIRIFFPFDRIREIE
jgi:signal peptidase I